MTTIQQAEARAAAMRASWSRNPGPTPLGQAVVAIAQIRRMLLAMDQADRDEVADMLIALLGEQDIIAWSNVDIAPASQGG